MRNIRAARTVNELERIILRRFGRLNINGEPRLTVLSLNAREKLNFARRRPEARFVVKSQQSLRKLFFLRRREPLADIDIWKHRLTFRVARAPVVKHRVARFHRVAAEETVAVARYGRADGQGNLPVFPAFAKRLHWFTSTYFAAVHTEGCIPFVIHGRRQHQIHVMVRFISIKVIGCK